MKKLTTIAAAIALFFGATAFSPEPTTKNALSRFFVTSKATSLSSTNVTRLVTDAFGEKFADAKDVSWTKAENFYFADFKVQEGRLAVAYDESGEFVAIQRMIDFNNMPMAAEEAIREQFKGFNLPETVSEIALLGDTNYYLTVEGKSAYFQIKSSPDGQVSVEKRIKKKVLVGKVY